MVSRVETYHSVLRSISFFFFSHNLWDTLKPKPHEKHKLYIHQQIANKYELSLDVWWWISPKKVSPSIFDGWLTDILSFLKAQTCVWRNPLLYVSGNTMHLFWVFRLVSTVVGRDENSGKAGCADSLALRIRDLCITGWSHIPLRSILLSIRTNPMIITMLDETLHMFWTDNHVYGRIIQTNINCDLCSMDWKNFVTNFLHVCIICDFSEPW
jgi:hypothetical protein